MDHTGNNLTILVVGNIGQYLSEKPNLPFCSDTIYCVFDDLTSAFLEQHQPHVVLSPLITLQHDIIELAVVLDKLNYAGQFRAIVAPLPEPDVIYNEIKIECPALDFDLITVRPSPNFRSV